MSSAKIITEHYLKPGPDRQWDWSAVRDDYDGAPDSHCPVGYGTTEKAAIDNLLEQELAHNLFEGEVRRGLRP